MKAFWAFKALANQKGELYLYGPISDSSWFDDETSPAQFQKDLAALGQIEALDVFINSPGGDVFAGITIYNILKRHQAKVCVHVDGVAASAASIVAMAGDKIVMPRAATLMIHNAWGFAAGNKTSMRNLADELERIDGQLAGIYAARTGKDTAIVGQWMDAERWMSGDEALADGFCDEVEENKQIAACADAGKFFARYLHPPEIAPETEPETKEKPKEPEEPEAAEEGGILMPDNGGDSQPVADKLPDLTDQRKHFTATKRKLLEV